MSLLLSIGKVSVYQETDRRLHWVSGAAIDIDGANGMHKDAHGQPMFAYKPDDKGLDALANAGYPHSPDAYRDILVCDQRDRPIVFKEGAALGYYSRTAYARPEQHWTLQERWLDAAAIPYVVINPVVRRKCLGIVLGCKARVTYNGKTIDAVVGDVSGARRIGELSYAAAKQLGMNPSPRSGGVSGGVQFECWPGTPAVLDGEVFTLIRA